MPGDVAHPPLTRAGGTRARGHGGLDEIDGVGVDEIAQLLVRKLPLDLHAAALGGGKLRHARPELLDPCGVRGHGNEVGLGKVPVVLGVGLHAARRRRPVALVVVAGLLDHGPAGCEDGGLSANLVPDGVLDASEGVDVLRLSAGAEGSVGPFAQRHVDVGADVAPFHSGLGDPQGAEDVAQGANVGSGDLRGLRSHAGGRVRDDLDEGHARAVVIHERVVRPLDPSLGAAHVGVLSGVLLHVRALDRETIGRAVGQVDVEVALVGDRLVRLGGLEGLRQIGIEVVLARESARGRD